jgi:hypothetical protein
LCASTAGRKVLLVGRVVSLENSSMRVETCDKRTVTVALKAGAGAYANSDYIEFEATVESQDAVRELDHAKFGTSFGALRLRLSRKTRGHTACPGLGAPSLCHRVVALTPTAAISYLLADMDNYNELVKLVHGKEQALFF